MLEAVGTQLDIGGHNERNPATLALTIRNASLTELVLCSDPKDRRSEFRSPRNSGFIAVMTCDASAESAKHADPEDAQIPS